MTLTRSRGEGASIFQQIDTMAKHVTIVMYHYVRRLEGSRFPAIKGLSIERFRRQLDYLQAHYTPVRLEDLLAALEAEAWDLPANAVLLTFDDGYVDHFTNVFPLLDERGIQGCFFPPAKAVLEGAVLDVNKIHFILASVADPSRLLHRLLVLLDDYRGEHEPMSLGGCLERFGGGHRYDPPEVVAFKRLLQRELAPRIREPILRQLFAEHVTRDEAAFAGELYMSLDELACLRRNGMHVGSHGYSHAWLNHLSPLEQASEIDESLKFLKRLGVREDAWSMCYPYGGQNASLLEILRQRGCRAGFGVEPRVADLETDERLVLPRLDTNDLPN